MELFRLTDIHRARDQGQKIYTLEDFYERLQ